MQTEIDAMTLDLEVQLLGINRTGAESGNAAICDGRDLPWLQDTTEQDVWGSWAVTWRDVVVLDGENRTTAIFNLTEHNLSIPANYDSLLTILTEAAGQP